MGTFDDFISPKACQDLYAAKRDMEGHDWYWAVVTDKTNIADPDNQIEAILTTQEAIDEHPEEFADMEIVPAYEKAKYGEELYNLRK